MKVFDGNDEIIYSNSFNVYESCLKIKEIEGFDFEFIFEKEERKEALSDVKAEKKGEKCIEVVFSKKIRGKLGVNTATKMPILMTDDLKQILMSVFCQSVGTNDSLHVTVSFYKR